MTKLFKPSLPEVAPATPLPQEDDLTAARKKRLQKETTAGGYSSTILSTAGSRETLGA